MARPIGSGNRRTQVPGDLVKRYVRLPARRLAPATLQRLIESRERSERALQLRKAGVTYAEIAKAVGYKNAGSASQAVKKAIDRLGLEAAKDVVTLDLARLDEMQMQLTAKFRAGDMRMTGLILSVMQMRQNLLGITTDTYREEQAKSANVSVTNNSVMVVNGSQSDYVRSMMSAVGMDMNSPDVKKYLEEIGDGDSQPNNSGRPALPPGVTQEPGAGVGAASPYIEDKQVPAYLTGEVISSTIEESIAVQDEILNRRARAEAPIRDELDCPGPVPDIPLLYVSGVDDE